LYREYTLFIVLYRVLSKDSIPTDRMVLLVVNKLPEILIARV